MASEIDDEPIRSSDENEPLDSVAAARAAVEEESEDDEHGGFQEGFTVKTFIGALFVTLIMTAGAIYLGLVAGQGLGPAAQWVTIVLFAEVARRSFLPLSRQEIYILFYVAGGLASVALQDRGISGGPIGALIWNQYFVQSPQAAPIAKEIPWFATPQPGSPALDGRTFFHRDWFGPLGVLIAAQLLERISWLPAGYVLFRATSDVERLPFPLASVAASGATALAEAGSKEDSWRWRIFSTGTTIGLIFGAFYVAIPGTDGRRIRQGRHVDPDSVRRFHALYRVISSCRADRVLGRSGQGADGLRSAVRDGRGFVRDFGSVPGFAESVSALQGRPASVASRHRLHRDEDH